MNRTDDIATDSMSPKRNSMVEPQGCEPLSARLVVTTTDATPAVTTDENPTEISRTGRIRKKRAIELNSCVCGVVVLQTDVESGDTVMNCRGPGCETVWVRIRLMIRVSSPT